MDAGDRSTISIFFDSPLPSALPSRYIHLPSDLPLPSLKSRLLETLKLASVHPSQLLLTLNGKSLDCSGSKVADVVLSAGTPRLSFSLRLLGGGGDGGATGAESRDCYLSMYLSKKPDKADPNETRLSRWTTCPLSGEPLTPPVVADRLGYLYNKEALVENLLRKTLPKQLSYIKGLKDMVPVILEEIPGASGDTRFHCPITGLEFNGKYPFVVLTECGHALSTKAFKEVKSSTCLVCHKEYKEEARMPINGNEEEVKALRSKMEEERGRKKEKKAGNVVSCGKHKAEMNGGCLEDTRKEASSVKRFKATDFAPANATKEVYASIFTSSKKSGIKETYSCRALPLGRN